MERRRKLSQGKGALPAAAERVRSGFREAVLPLDVASAPDRSAAPAPAPAPTPAARPSLEPVGASAPAAPSEAAPSQAAGAAASSGSGFGSGRAASMARRKALSMGKGGLPAAVERLRSGFRTAALPAALPGDAARSAPRAALAESAAAAVGRAAAPSPTEPSEATSGREIARRHRMIRAQIGRGAAAPATPSRPARQGDLVYPAKVPVVRTVVANASVTGLSYAVGRAVTGAEAGFDKPLTGTQYVAGAEGSYRAAPGKVGHARTSGGQTVSGTMVRSGVRITGDEGGSEIAITGNADQTLADDLTQRDESAVPVAAQFRRQSQPHGHSVHGTHLGRSARAVGLRPRDAERPLEQTDGGHPVTGTAIGRSVRVTGGEAGSFRRLTGSQYFAPAMAQTAARSAATGRNDPVTGAKVTRSRTWGGQTVTGPQMEHDARVTGSEHGTCATLTGTPYYGASGAYGWCDSATAECEAALRRPRPARPVTGNVPLNDPAVSGTQRGAQRTITGSAYFVAEAAAAGGDAAGDRVGGSIRAFSVQSPQRSAHLASRAGARDARPAAAAITGTFAQGGDKITGNVEFSGVSRRGQPGAQPARGAVSGEGSVKGPVITGSAWSEDRRITGTEDYIATTRNPSARGEGEHGFAGTARFKATAAKARASRPEQKILVTGTVGWTQGSGATLTVSGGAAG